MATITLKRGYYIEIDALNYTLRQKYIGTTKTGEPKEASRTIGFFGKMEPALKKYLEVSHLDVLKDEKLTIEEYIKAIRQINEESLQGLREELKRFLVK